MLTLKDMVRDQRPVRFLRYSHGDLWYTTEDGFEFPVPVSDVGTATMLASDKAILFMRYLRRHLTMLAQARTEGS